MIPDINQIIDGLLSGQYSREQALAWLDQHMKLASESDDLRDHFAGLAMQACVADPNWRRGQEAATAETAYLMADAMMKARAA